MPAGAFGATARRAALSAGCQDVSDPPTSLRQCVLAKKIEVARTQIAQGAFGAAENKLRQDVAPKVDGDFAGGVANDWLTDQAARIAIYCEVLYLVEDLAAFQQDWFFDQAGVKDGGGYQPGSGEETVNLFNGNLLLTYTDLRLPGKGGLDLVITRSYNSKVVRWNGDASEPIGGSWLGLGWTLHLGRVYHADYADDKNPTVVTPDGSRERVFPDVVAGVDFTKSFRRYEYDAAGGVATLRGRDGTVFEFGHLAADEEGFPFLALTRISSASGANAIAVEYDEELAGKRNLKSIRDTYGRTVTFSTAAPAHERLEQISFTAFDGAPASIRYEVKDTGQLAVLSAVTPPAGPGVSYTYATGHFPELRELRNPYGGLATYEHDTRYRYVSDGVRSTRVPSRVLVSRQHAGDFGTARWTYDYPSSGETYVRTIDPLGNVTRSFFHGLGSTSLVMPYNIGLSFRTEYYDGTDTGGYANLARREETDYDFRVLSSDPVLGMEEITWPGFEDAQLARVALPAETRVELHRPGTTAVDLARTYYLGYDAYGNPGEVQQTGWDTTALLRRAEYERAWTGSQSLAAANLVALVSAERIYDEPAGTLLSETRHTYGTSVSASDFGRVTETVVDPSGLRLVTRRSYDGDGNLERVIDPRGKQWEAETDHGTLESVRTPRGWQSFTRAIDASTGLARSETDANGNTTTFAYDALGRRTRTGFPGDNPLEVEYEAGEQVVRRRGDAETVEALDDLGRVVRVRTAAGPGAFDYIHYRYDAVGRRTFASAPTSAQTCSPCAATSHAYDALGREVERTDPFGTWTYRYDGNAVRQTDPLGRTRETVTDPSGNVVELVDETGTAFRYAYDALSRLSKIDAPGGDNDRELVYDRASRLTRELHPETGWVDYQYDENGNQRRRTRRGGAYVEQQFDDNNRVTSRFFSDVGRTTSFTYDERTTQQTRLGYLTAARFNGGSTDYLEYDALGRVRRVKTTYPVGSYELQYRYDANGNLVGVTYPNDYELRYTRGQDNRISALGDFATALDYDAAGGLKAVRFANGVTTTVEPSGADPNRPGRIKTTGGIFDRLYQYDRRGNPARIFYGGGTIWDDLSYDAKGRVASADYAEHGTLSFAHEPHGSVESVTSTVPGQPSASWTYRGNRVTAAGYAYHLDGWLTAYPTADTGETKHLDYGYDGLLVSAQGGEGAAVSFDYDAAGQRCWRSTVGSEQYYLYDESGNPLAEIDGEGELRRIYAYSEDTLIGRMDLAPGWSTVPVWSRTALAGALGLLTCALWWRQRRLLAAGAGLALAAMVQLGTADAFGTGPYPAKRYFYHLDHLGSVVAMSDQHGAVVWPADFSGSASRSSQPVEYMPWGAVFDGGERQLDSAEVENDRRFIGGQYDKQLDLTYLRARYLES
ncbi:MAG: hypothetical protein HYV63_23130, partial [Candidatus Schekmanbacteria bacterium]|nr:hypothetical protein [Candidatus Schekmanbacteria bacterium]